MSVLPIGLTETYRLDEGERTPATRQYSAPMVNGMVGASNHRELVKGEMVYPFPAEKCFELLKDYRLFLTYHLKRNETAGRKHIPDFTISPEYIQTGDSGVDGEVGSLVQYAYWKDGVVYWMVDKVMRLEDGEETDANGNKIFVFAMETQREKVTPRLPMQNHGFHIVFTTFEKNPNQCHMRWVRKYNKPRLLCLFSLAQKFRGTFEADMQKGLFDLWVVFHARYSPKLPKRDNRILVIGAGPSGLHMTYELIQRGVSPEQITILEKTSRFGGKTLSVMDRSEVQINHPTFNPPTLPVSKRCAKLRALDCRKLGPDQLQNVKRKFTPNALQPQENYFTDGEPVYHELGTCYLSPAYYAIRTLLKEVQGKVEDRVAMKEKLIQNGEQVEDLDEWKKKAEEDITREVGPDSYAIESSTWKGAYSLERWIYETGKRFTWLDNIFFCTYTLRKGCVDLTVLGAKVKYCEYHEQLLGNYHYTLPPHPDDKHFKDLVKPFGQFLRDKKLNNLIPLFTYGLTAQGYGIVEETATFLAMQWLTPDLLDGYFEWYEYFEIFYKNSVGEVVHKIPAHLKKFDNLRKGMLVSGWRALWARICDLYQLQHRIKYNVEEIKSITRGDTVDIEYVHEGKEFKEQYDFLIMAAPLTDAYEDPTKPILNLDFTEQEKELFVTSDVTAGKFKTNLFKPERSGKYESDHLRIFIDAIMNEDDSKVGTGDVFAVRDSYKAIQPRLSTKNGDRFDPRKDAVREKMCYQYVSPGKNVDEEDLDQKFVNFMLEHLDYLKVDQEELDDVEGARKDELANRIRDKVLITKHAWTYYTHYKNSGLLNGKLWKILDIQGQNRTLFVHASTNFESVLDIVNYNHMLLDGLAGRLDNMVKPETDPRPEPWQRPQPYLLNSIKLFLLLRLLFNLLIGIIWTLYYVISYIPAEYLFLRWGRYKLQKDFKTPKLGNFLTFDMAKFLKVIPSVRGYEAHCKSQGSGIPSPIPEDYDAYKWEKDLGPGDTIFKELMDPKLKFKEKFPGVPDETKVISSFQWNLTDFRTGIRYWLSSFHDGFQPLLTPGVESIIQGFSYLFPNQYSWFFSWIFATQFRLLIGYSYRFEDKKGGGLYIPDCHMLRVGVKKYGTEVGQRICLTVCKIFTEEVLRKKKLKADFQPNFLKGKGYGCTVRMENPVNHAYSNHSLFQVRSDADKEAIGDIKLEW